VFELLDRMICRSVLNGCRVKTGSGPTTRGGLTVRHASGPTSNPKFSFGLVIFVLPHSRTSDEEEPALLIQDMPSPHQWLIDLGV